MPKKTAVEQRLDDLDRKLDEWGERFERALEKHATEDARDFEKQDDRIKTLELAKATFSGKTALLAFILTLLASSVSAAVVARLLR